MDQINNSNPTGECGKSLVFVSGTGWDGYVRDQFRTRQGALLKTFVETRQFAKVVLVVESGFRGNHKIQEIQISNLETKVIEIAITSRLPEVVIRPFGQHILKHNYQLPTTAIEMLQKESPELIWSYSVGLAARLKTITNASLIYDVVDYRVNDENLTGLQRYLWHKELESACLCSDYVACNGETAHQQLSQYAGNKCVLIRNGVTPERFHNNDPSTCRQNVGFVGVISKWIDFRLLQTLFERLPGIHFDFYGIVKTAESSLRKLMLYPNFHWHGLLLPQDVPTFLSKCRVAIVPYEKKVVQGSTGDSMKIFEYLAAGTPVVSTNFQPHLDGKFSGLIQVCEDPEQFVTQIERLYTAPPDPIWKAKAWDFVLANSWKSRVEEIIKLASEYRVTNH
jgi:glycosyltransferase involved in cell wall biosynthesis